ncbi:DMT family transporter [Arcobacter roscoffensis]|uniref:DMT family transporter n=1 Tax=Arcobacter roscoffensis TaxID=2961520 RepID=A0ABY5E6K5_9BACT|nr:DMT family transporter [Arcobacter roscoffensis]UTJ07257.1 DMT family transporter [Arcobacter roscoffensis]
MSFLKKEFELFVLITLSLIFLSLNSILCKIALVNEYIDAYSFTFFRVFFAFLTLLILITLRESKKESKLKKISLKGNWLSSFMLFIYAIGFSYSYLNLEAGFGTLLLFTAVQLTMLITSLFYKEKININKFIGIILAFIGLSYLLYPSKDFDISYFHLTLMVISGIAWGIYSVIGKSSKDALFNTYDNFFKALIFTVIFFVFVLFNTLQISVNGILLSFLSGSITSAIGYVIWYKVLPNIKIVTASILQLLVPVIAIILSVVFLGEIFTMKLLIATLLVSVAVLISVIKKESNQNT